MKYENIKMIGDETTVRYVLENQSKRILYVIGINPSTANEKTPDPTMRRVMAFAENNGFDGFAMLNLYPQRSKHPWELHQERCDELHKNNLEAIKSLFINVQSPTILLAFGNNIGIRSYLKDCLRDIVGIIQPISYSTNFPSVEANRQSYEMGESSSSSLCPLCPIGKL